MATNHTENYNLNLWEPTDSFVREEFNQNTSKIDEVLHRADRRGMEVIREYTTTETKSFIYIGLEGLDLTEWKTIHIDVIPAEGSTENAILTPYSSEYNLPRLSSRWNRLTLFPMGQPEAPMAGISYGKTASVFFFPSHPMRSCMPRIYGDSGTDQIPAGTKIIVRGERM